jgi:peptide deformylase
MSQIPIRLYGDPVLRRKAAEVKTVDDDLRTLAADMIETMQEADGIGLAANQVGDLRRILVVNFDLESGGEGATALVNPVITGSEGEMRSMEGCLSIPDVWDEIDRAARVTVSWTDLEGEDRQTETGGLHGAVVQHEIDHLDGVLFIDYLPMVRKMMLKGTLKQIARQAKERM